MHGITEGCYVGERHAIMVSDCFILLVLELGQNKSALPANAFSLDLMIAVDILTVRRGYKNCGFLLAFT